MTEILAYGFLCFFDVPFLRRVNVGGSVTQYEFSNSYEVHNLGNTEERGDNQGPAAGPFEKCPGTLFFQNLPTV